MSYFTALLVPSGRQWTSREADLRGAESLDDLVDTVRGEVDSLTGLVVLERDDALTWLSLRNVASVHLLAVDQLNTYDVLLCDDVVFTKGAYDAFVSGTAKEVTK